LLLALSFLAVSVIWGSTYLGIRIALESFPPFFIGAARFLVAGAVLLIVAVARGEKLPSAVEWRSAAATGALFFVVGNGLVNLAERSVSSGLASVLVAMMPLWATLFSRFFGDRVSRDEAAGVALGLVGVSVMNAGGELRASPAGAACALLAPMGWALGSIASKRMPLPKDVVTRTGAQMLTGGGAMLVLSTALGEHLGTPTSRAALALAYLAVFGSLVGFSAYSYLLANARTSVATSYAYVNPVIAVALGIALAGERLDLASALGAAIVLGAVLLVARARGKTPSGDADTKDLELGAAPRSTPPRHSPQAGRASHLT
jgi:drug/metabolite transporter (DMT)-like permease